MEEDYEKLPKDERVVTVDHMRTVLSFLQKEQSALLKLEEYSFNNSKAVVVALKQYKKDGRVDRLRQLGCWNAYESYLSSNTELDVFSDLGYDYIEYGPPHGLTMGWSLMVITTNGDPWEEDGGSEDLLLVNNKHRINFAAEPYWDHSQGGNVGNGTNKAKGLNGKEFLELAKEIVKPRRIVKRDWRGLGEELKELRGGADVLTHGILDNVDIFSEIVGAFVDELDEALDEFEAVLEEMGNNLI